MAQTRNGLRRVLEHRRQEQRRCQIAVGEAEAALRQRLRSVATAEQELRDAVRSLGENARDGAALRASGQRAAHLRQRLQQERCRAAVALGEVIRARERLTSAAREQAAIERLLARHRCEQETEQARTDRATHDECAAQAQRLRDTLYRTDTGDGMAE